MYKIMSSANSDSFTSSFPICIHFIFLSCLITLTRTSNTMFSCYSHAFWEKLTQKDNADSGMQFIMPAGPRQSLLLAKGPNQHL